MSKILGYVKPVLKAVVAAACAAAAAWLTSGVFDWKVVVAAAVGAVAVYVAPNTA